LAKQLSNPIASLISVPAQVNVDFGYGGGEGWRSTTNLQPVAPIDLNKQWNLISRTILPAIFQDNINGSGIESGIGDTR
ncbi:MAG: transporter, partial [Verrucomicrobia bacterium]